MKSVQGRISSKGTYQEWFEREWKQITKRLKESGVELGRIKISGTERNYAKRNFTGD